MQGRIESHYIEPLERAVGYREPLVSHLARGPEEADLAAVEQHQLVELAEDLRGRLRRRERAVRERAVRESRYRAVIEPLESREIEPS